MKKVLSIESKVGVEIIFQLGHADIHKDLKIKLKHFIK